MKTNPPILPITINAKRRRSKEDSVQNSCFFLQATVERVLLGANPWFGIKNAPTQMPMMINNLKNQNLTAKTKSNEPRSKGRSNGPILKSTARIFGLFHTHHDDHHQEEETGQRKLNPIDTGITDNVFTIDLPINQFHSTDRPAFAQGRNLISRNPPVTRRFPRLTFCKVPDKPGIRKIHETTVPTSNKMP